MEETDVSQGLLGLTGIHWYDAITLFQDYKETKNHHKKKPNKNNTINNRVHWNILCHDIVTSIAVHKALMRATVKYKMQRKTCTDFATKIRNTVFVLYFLLYNKGVE